MNKTQLKYCSLDIETSGFDPLKNEILEVGFAFFELTREGIKITEEFTQVFRPEKEVPPAIFGLTGIAQEELDAAPAFKDYKQVLQEKLGEAVIVGHNVIFDIKFLESSGIKFSGQVIDTLDLVQFILPTHHSYNLENLMHFFRVAHKEAHRALADAKADLVVLENLLRLYCGFPADLKKQILELAAPLQAPWQELMQVPLQPVVLPLPAKPGQPEKVRTGLEIKPGTVYDFPLGRNFVNETILALKQQKDKSLLIVSKESEVLRLWKEGAVEAVFPPELLFSEEKFSVFLKKKNLSPEETRFLLKILVWKQTNWQHECLLDLNLSFFGGQFRELVSGGVAAEKKTPKLLCCSVATLEVLAQEGLYKARLAVVEGLSEFEQQISLGLTIKVSWGYVNFLLKNYYNPELGIGQEKYKEEIMSLLNASDLFFGLSSAFFQNGSQNFQYVKVTKDLTYSDKFQKLAKAAEGFAAKLSKFGKKVSSVEIMRVTASLGDFFVFDEAKVQWLEVGENRCVLFSAPLEVLPQAEKIFKVFKKLSFIDSLGSEKIFAYFFKRLGLKGFKRVYTQDLPVTKQPAEAVAQGDLFLMPNSKKPLGDVVAVAERHQQANLTRVKPTVKLFVQPRVAGEEDIMAWLEPACFPAAVLFGTAAQVREFYEANYLELKTKASVLANTHSGGGAKLFHNFSINKNSVLLATDKFLLKYLGQTQGTEPVNRLAVKVLVVCHLPFEQFTHPYQEAVAAQFENAFSDFSLPKAVYNLHKILQFFSTPALETVYICDAKLAKGYAQVFKEYLQSLPWEIQR